MADMKLNLQVWPIEDVTPYDLNAKKHDKAQVASIAKSIREFNFDVPIVVDRHGVIIKGHGRRLAAIELGLKKVPVLVRDDLSDAQVRASRLADNRVAISDIDPEVLRSELSSLDYDLIGIFDEKELTFATADLGVMNVDAFVSDMDVVLQGQADETADRMAKATDAAARVTLAKAFGFKDISAAGGLAITNLMAKAEAATGLKNDEALIAFASGL